MCTPDRTEWRQSRTTETPEIDSDSDESWDDHDEDEGWWDGEAIDDEGDVPLVQPGHFVDNQFWMVYRTVKPTGTPESWAEDIGFPTTTVLKAFVAMYHRILDVRRKPMVYLLWTLSWYRKHNTLRSMAAEWITSKTKFHKEVRLYTVYMTSTFGWVRCA